MIDRRRIVHIDLLETIAMFFVVFYHSTIYSFDFLADGAVKNHVYYYLRTIVSTCVPLFFLANGYLLFGREFQLKKHLQRMLKLVLLTVIWNIITLALLQLVHKVPFSMGTFIQTLWTRKLGWTNHLWYMGTLVGIYIFFPLLKHAFDTNRKVFSYFVSISAVLTLGNTLLNQIASLVLGRAISGFQFFNIFNPFTMSHGYSVVYFCMGGLAYSLRDKLLAIPVRRRNVCSIMGIILSCAGLWGVGYLYSIQTDTVWDVVWNGYDSVFTLANTIFIYLLSLNLKADLPLVRCASRNTLGIYFLHMIVVHITSPYLAEISFGGNILYAVGVMAVCMVIASVLGKIPVVSKLVS